METMQLLRNLIASARFTSFSHLIALIHAMSAMLTVAQPVELTIGNVIRRATHLIREETLGLMKQELPASSHEHQYQSEEMVDVWSKVNLHLIKPVIVQVTHELMDEIENGYANIAAQSLDHIHSQEIIMTTGQSKTVEEFLKAARRKRAFQVIIAEQAPEFCGREMATRLALAGIETTLIGDAAVYAVMSRVNKVILGTHAILANGGLIGCAGTHAMAAAAKYHHIPVVVLSGLYKLSVKHPYDQDMFNQCLAPSETLLKYEEGWY
jgi:translation initiation factor eIF-2B subunit beta